MKIFVASGLLLLFNYVQCQNEKLIPIAKPADVEYAKPWEKGINICAYLSRSGILEHKLYSSCLPWKQEFCGAKSDFTYDCCPGYLKSAAFKDKCVEVERTWKIIPEHLSITGFPKFSRFIASSTSSINDAKSKDTYTVFAPYKDQEMTSASNYRKVNEDATGSDEYLSQFTDESESSVSNNNSVSTNNQDFLGFVVPGRVYASSLKNGVVLPTFRPDYSLKVSRYYNGIICVECREIVEPDHEAKNGVIHFLSRALDVNTQRPLFEVLSRNSDISAFFADLPENVKSKLQTTNKWYTVFAPNNAVWDMMKTKFGQSMLSVIAANHVIEGLFCKAALIKSTDNFATTELGESLSVTCDTKGNRIIKSFCNYAVTLGSSNKEIMASNGVLYLVNDNALVPKAALSIQDYSRTNKCTGSDSDWLKALSSCDLRMEPNKKYAVLIPTANAMKWWMNYPQFKTYYSQFKNNTEFRCRLIRYHIMEMEDAKLSKLSYLWHQQDGYKTNNKDELYEVDYFRKRFTDSELNFHYSPVDKFESISFSDGSIYKINRVNMIPEKTIMQILKSRTDLSNSNEVAVSTNVESSIFVRNKPLNLMLAIKNGPWKDMVMQQSNDYAIKWMQLHWVNMYLWGGDIGYFDVESRHRFMSGAGLELIFDRRADGNMYIGWENLPDLDWAKVVETNNYGIDGMVWILDKAIVCPENVCPTEQNGGKGRSLEEITESQPESEPSTTTTTTEKSVTTLIPVTETTTALYEKTQYVVLVFSCWDAWIPNYTVAKKKEFYGLFERWLNYINRDDGDQCYFATETPVTVTRKHVEDAVAI